MRSVALILLAAACGRERHAAPVPAPTSSPSPSPSPSPAAPLDPGAAAAPSLACESLPFAHDSPVPEASGAAWLAVDSVPALVVISDSGNDGAYAIIDPETGVTREQGKLPLGTTAPGADDLEGVATRGDTVYAVSSPGWIRAWKRAGHGFALVDGPYPLGPEDLPNRKGGMGDAVPTSDGMVCGAAFTNCGRNYEGLCLAPPGPEATDELAGFVAAKADGHLYALALVAGRLVVDRTRAIAIASNGVIADCAFDTDGTLLVGSNSLDFGGVFRVDGWRNPATATVTRLTNLLLGFPETLAVRGDTVYRMSDLGGAPSLLAKYRCAGLRSFRAVPLLPR